LFQALYFLIGYREFCGYLEDPNEENYTEAIERMKISTRQYAKRQISWIRNKLIPALDATNTKEVIAPLYLLDATGKSKKQDSLAHYPCLLIVLGDQWQSNVHMPATRILDGEYSSLSAD